MNMMHAICAHTRGEAWARAVDTVAKHGKPGREPNIVIHVEQPWVETEHDGDIRRKLDQHYLTRREPCHPTSTVADTIFPSTYYQRFGPEGVHERYLEDFDALRALDPGGWGTYAQRLVSIPKGKDGFVEVAAGVRFNPLREIIERMKTAQTSRTRWKNCYELPIYRPEEDFRLRMRAPCLSHLSFKPQDGTLHLTAQYRHQDYRFKLAGNLLGLARLQAFVATEAGISIGTLTIHSVAAYLEADPPGMREFKAISAGALSS